MNIAMHPAIDGAVARPAARIPAMGRLEGMVGALLRALRYRACYSGTMRELQRMDAHLLRDIGVPSWNLEAVVHDLAEAKAALPVRPGLLPSGAPLARLLWPRATAVPGLRR